MVLVPARRPGRATSSGCCPRWGSTTSRSATARSPSPTSACRSTNFVSGPGEAFEIAQGRLGPGRVHHCMRLIGLAEKALELACQRGTERVAFGKPLANLGGNRERIAEPASRSTQARLLVLNAAWKLDTVGPLGALSEVSQIKVAAPRMAQAGDRLRDADPRRRRAEQRLPAGRGLDRRPRAAAGRRARRGAPRHGRAARARQVRSRRRSRARHERATEPTSRARAWLDESPGPGHRRCVRPGCGAGRRS